jgi:hypothetical protein
VKTEIQLRGANCPVCFETVREMLLEDSRVTAVHSSFSSHCIEVEHGAMSAEELMDSCIAICMASRSPVMVSRSWSMSNHRSANGTATDDSPAPVAHRTIEAKISRGWGVDVRVVVHDRFSRTPHRCPLRRTSDA